MCKRSFPESSLQGAATILPVPMGHPGPRPQALGTGSVAAGGQASHHLWQEVPPGDPATFMATQGIYVPPHLPPGCPGNTTQGHATISNSRTGASAISKRTRGSGGEGHEARSSRNLKIWIGKSCGHREGQGQDRRGDGTGVAWCTSMVFHKMRNKQDLPIFPLLLNPYMLVTKKTSIKVRKNMHMCTQ